MISADVHNMETPSPLPTPGYLPLLSEASTPLTPTMRDNTSKSLSSSSPRISFRSFTLNINLDEDKPILKVDNEETAPSDNGDSEVMELRDSPIELVSTQVDYITNVF